AHARVGQPRTGIASDPGAPPPLPVAPAAPRRGLVVARAAVGAGADPAAAGGPRRGRLRGAAPPAPGVGRARVRHGRRVPGPRRRRDGRLLEPGGAVVPAPPGVLARGLAPQLHPRPPPRPAPARLPGHPPDFMAVTYPLSSGAVQLNYQRVFSFSGNRTIERPETDLLIESEAKGGLTGARP